jgi:uncharacterized membrane protein YcaP (DUF421 family)
MDQSTIHIDDFKRVFFGVAPPGYLLEVVVRVVLIYLLIIMAIRFMGKGMNAELGRTELIARVSLAMAVGMAIERPERGLLVSTLIVLIIISVDRVVTLLVFYRKGFEKKYCGVPVLLVSDGILDYKRIKKIPLSKERVFAALRQEGIKHLGEVKLFYIEANGKFSLLKEKPAKSGLPIIPRWDQELRDRQKKTDRLFCTDCEMHCEAGKMCPCGCDEQEQGIR